MGFDKRMGCVLSTAQVSTTAEETNKKKSVLHDIRALKNDIASVSVDSGSGGGDDVEDWRHCKDKTIDTI